MEINKIKFAKVVEAALAKAAGHPRWLKAIDRAAKEIVSGEMIVTILAHGALITTTNGTYAADGHCNCEAARHSHKECKHRAGARLMDLYESEPDAPAPRVVRSTEREFNAKTGRPGRRFQIVTVDGWSI